MARKRVLLVDDSVVIRKFLSDLVDDDPSLEVAGAAPNGAVALTKIDMARPDVVVLDVEMPVMGGLETLKAIKKDRPGLPVIMFSSVTTAGADETVEALRLGAAGYIAKPGDASERAVAGAQLIERIHAVTGGRATASRAPRATSDSAAARTVAARKAASDDAPAPTHATTAAVKRLPTRSGSMGKVDVLAIGASTGGPDALAHFFAALSPPPPVPILIVQHMPAHFTGQLARRLTRVSGIPVQEAVDGVELQPGQAYLAPGGYHMVLARQLSTVRLCLNQDPPVNSCRPSVDVLFESVQAVYRQRALAVVFTGMGEDGLRGATALSEAGAQLVVQDEATSVVWGMAGAIANAGIAKQVLPLDELAPEVTRRVHFAR